MNDAQPQEHELRLDGARVRYLEAGAGEPVLLLHGFPQSHACWRHQMPALAKSHRVIAPDWPGFGQSEPGASPPDYDTEVLRLGALADALGLTRFNLVAHDYGGFVGLGFLLRSPARVLRFGILNSRAHRIFRPAFYRFSLAQGWVASHAVTSALGRTLPLGAYYRRAFRKYRALGCFDDDVERGYLHWMDTPAGRRWYFRFFAHYHVPERPELARGLPDVACPTAVIWGDRDPYVPTATARELAALIPGAALTILSGADHFVNEERPGEVTAALQELLTRPT